MIEKIGDFHSRIYSPTTTVKIGGKKYKNVEIKDEKNYVENGKRQTVDYIKTANAQYSIYNRHNRVDQISASYDRPKPMEFNGKTYNISYYFKNRLGAVYEQINPKTYGITKIEVDKSGKVLNIDEPLENKIANGVKKVINKISKGVKRL